MLQSLTFHKQKNLFNGVNLSHRVAMTKSKRPKVEHQRFTPIIAVVFLAIALLIPQCINIGGVSVDYYYMLKDGRYLLDHPWSFPKSNVFSYIPGQKILFQQWGYMILTAFLTRTFGKAIGTILLVDLSVALFVISFVWFFRLRKIPLSLSFLFAVLLEVIEPYHGVRPELLTIALLMLQICGLERFCNVGEKVETLPFFRAKKWRWLLFLPFMTILEMNLHGSMWIMHFVVVLPYLVQWLFHRRFHRQQYPRWYGIFLFLGMVSMIPCLFLNPYGIDGILYLPRSMKYLNQYGRYISELRSVTMPKQIGLIFFSPWVRVMFGVLLLTVLTTLTMEWNECEAIKQLVACFGRIVPRSEPKVHSIEWKKLHIGDFCMILGLTALAWTKVRQTMWMDIAFAFLIAWAFELVGKWNDTESIKRFIACYGSIVPRSEPKVHSIKSNTFALFSNRKSNNKLSFLVMALSALVLVTNTYATNLNATFHPKDSIITPTKAVRWLNAHGKSKASILCCHDFGSYLQYKGFRVAMDSRPECYSKAIGGRYVAENIVPLYDMKSYHIRNADAYYHKIMTLYRADYAIAYDRNDLFSYLIKNDPNYHAVVKGKGYILYEYQLCHKRSK